jgi:hypothetical protein
MRKSTKYLGQNSQYSSLDSNPGPPEYESGMITTTPPRSVNFAVVRVNTVNS